MFFRIALIITTCLGLPLQAQLIDKNQLYGALQQDISNFAAETVENLVFELAGKIEGGLRSDREINGTIHELLSPLQRFGIDPGQVTLTKDSVTLYRRYAQAGDTAALEDKLRQDLLTMLTPRLDAVSSEAIDALQKLLSEAADKVNNITGAAQDAEAEPPDPDVNISSFLGRYGLRPDLVENLEQAEKTYAAYKSKYGEYWEAFNTIRGAMGNPNPSAKVQALFDLGEKFGGRIPLIGKFVELYFTVAKGYLEAVTRLGKALRKFDQGCVGEATHGARPSLLSDTVNETFSRMFPGHTACPHGSKGIIYRQIYIDMQDSARIYFWHRNSFTAGNPEHGGISSISALRRWLIQHDHSDKADDPSFVIAAYNTAPGFPKFQRRAQELVSELERATSRFLEAFPACPDAAKEALGRQGISFLSAELGQTMEDATYSHFYQSTLLQALIEERFISRRARLFEKSRQVLENLEQNVPTIISGRFLPRNGAQPPAAFEVELSPAQDIFEPCSQVNGANDYEIVFFLPADNQQDITLSASGGGVQTQTERLVVQAGDRARANLFYGEAQPSCGDNETWDDADQTCVCRDGFERDGSGNCLPIADTAQTLQPLLDRLAQIGAELGHLANEAKTLKDQADSARNGDPAAGDLTARETALNELRFKLGPIATIVKQLERTHAQLPSLTVQIRQAADAVAAARTAAESAALDTCETAQKLQASRDQQQRRQWHTAMQTTAAGAGQKARAAEQAMQRAQSLLERFSTYREHVARETQNLQNLKQAWQTYSAQYPRLNTGPTIPISQIKARRTHIESRNETLGTEARGLYGKAMLATEDLSDPALRKPFRDQIARIYQPVRNASATIEATALPEDISGSDAVIRLRSREQALAVQINDIRTPPPEDATYRDTSAWVDAAELFLEPAQNAAKNAQICAGIEWRLPTENNPDPTTNNQASDLGTTSANAAPLNPDPNPAPPENDAGGWDDAASGSGNVNSSDPATIAPASADNGTAGSPGSWDDAAEDAQQPSPTNTQPAPPTASPVAPNIDPARAEQLIAAAESAANPPSCDYYTGLEYINAARKYNPNDPRLDDYQVRMRGLMRRREQALGFLQQARLAIAAENWQQALSAARAAKDHGTPCDRSKAEQLIGHIQNQITRTNFAAQRARDQREREERQRRSREAARTLVDGLISINNALNRGNQSNTPRPSLPTAGQLPQRDCDMDITWDGNNIRCNCPGYVFKKGKCVPGPDRNTGGGSNSNQPEQHITDIEVTRQTVTVKVWDHGCEDGDIINLYINGRAFLSGHRLSKGGKSFQVTLHSRQNTLRIEAVSAGTDCGSNAGRSETINTAAISVSDAAVGGRQSWRLKQGSVTQANLILR